MASIKTTLRTVGFLAAAGLTSACTAPSEQIPISPAEPVQTDVTSQKPILVGKGGKVISPIYEDPIVVAPTIDKSCVAAFDRIKNRAAVNYVVQNSTWTKDSLRQAMIEADSTQRDATIRILPGRHDPFIVHADRGFGAHGEIYSGGTVQDDTYIPNPAHLHSPSPFVAALSRVDTGRASKLGVYVCGRRP